MIDFKPESPEEIKARKALIEKNRVFKISFQEAITRISDLLFKISYTKKVPVNKENFTELGGVNFWIDQQNGMPVLMYNKHPSHWDKDAVIYALEMLEYSMLNINTFV